MVLTMYGEGAPRSTSQVLSVPAYVRKKALNPGRNVKYTRAQMVGNFLMYNLESGFQHGMWDLCGESGEKYLRL